MSDPQIGRLNTLRATSRHTAGMMLDGGELGDILMPNRYVAPELAIGDEIEVFLSLDSEDRLVATTERPLAMAGEFAMLEVAEITRVGAFLDWGMPKDLLLPFAEQIKRLSVGERELVYIHVDPVSRRLLASAKLRKWVEATAPLSANTGIPVTLRLAEKTDLGNKAIVNGSYWGLIQASSSDKKKIPRRGEIVEGFISRIRDDGLADVSLDPPGYAKVPATAEQLATALAETGDGFLPLHDKSPPEQIRATLGISKKVFKQALGALYKAGRIRIEEDGIHLVKKP